MKELKKKKNIVLNFDHCLNMEIKLCYMRVEVSKNAVNINNDK